MLYKHVAQQSCNLRGHHLLAYCHHKVFLHGLQAQVQVIVVDVTWHQNELPAYVVSIHQCSQQAYHIQGVDT